MPTFQIFRVVLDRAASLRAKLSSMKAYGYGAQGINHEKQNIVSLFLEIDVGQSAETAGQFLQVLNLQLNPLTEDQSFDVCNLQQSSQQAKDAT